MAFHIFSSVPYSSVTLIQANKCMQLYHCDNNMIKTTNSYMFPALMAYHQAVQ